jgi:rhamnulokinase
VSAGVVAAVDLGATSGRVILGRVGDGELRLDDVHRFPNGPVELPDGLHWDLLGLYAQVLDGLRRAGAAGGEGGVASIGIDAWGVDFGLLDGAGALLGNPFHYRDARNARGVELVHGRVSPERLYARTGIQHLPFNTVFQLAVAAATDPAFSAAASMLLIPDLLGYWLSGSRATERTNASTTGLLDPATGDWAWDVVDELGLPQALLGRIREPGERLGTLRENVAAATGLPASTPVTLVGSHDTASAVVAVPAEGDDAAWISCGTWGLVGVELPAPVLREAGRAANFTNELGVDGTVRYLRNVMGLWLLSETMRAWDRAGTPEDLETILGAAAALPGGGPTIDPDDPAFLPPGDMPSRILDRCARSGQPIPLTRAAIVRCILDSLALAFARAVGTAETLSGRAVSVVHLVGGGARNRLLCQLTADACERTVVAGPVEATALGNVLVQARALGFISGGLADLRALVRETQPVRRFAPRPLAGARSASGG